MEACLRGNRPLSRQGVYVILRSSTPRLTDWLAGTCSRVRVGLRCRQSRRSGDSCRQLRRTAIIITERLISVASSQEIFNLRGSR